MRSIPHRRGHALWKSALVSVALLLGPTCAPSSPDNAAIARDFAERRSNVEVTADATVTRVLADQSGPSGVHQRFIVRLRGLVQTVEIDNNTSIGRRVPIATGDDVLIHGEYVWNEQGGLIHFTHHDPRHTHEGGWVERDGMRYE